ncbi:hypothetical protein ACH4GK_17610 [Streptomyces rimosus]|uniref:hypothetical protein n=1 Tax=Streptomyces rimosus TaxID=1927 RepID=UPI0004C85444|nr:hypothetical protein [Streptomyces rimosus]
MNARAEIRRYVSLLGDSWTPRATTDARVEQVYAAVRAEVLRKAADEVIAHCPVHGFHHVASVFCHCPAADDLRRMADEAGKDTRTPGESTQPVCPVCQRPGCCCSCFGKSPQRDCSHNKSESTRAASPWQQAVDGLNALVDADIAVHVEPDGHIANPAGDEHIEWDRAAGRWRLVHGGEDAPETPACARCRQPFDPSDTRFDGRARHHGGPFCRRCVCACRYATDPFHRCVVCRASEGGDVR